MLLTLAFSTLSLFFAGCFQLVIFLYYKVLAENYLAILFTTHLVSFLIYFHAWFRQFSYVQVLVFADIFGGFRMQTCAILSHFFSDTCHYVLILDSFSVTRISLHDARYFCCLRLCLSNTINFYFILCLIISGEIFRIFLILFIFVYFLN